MWWFVSPKLVNMQMPNLKQFAVRLTGRFFFAVFSAFIQKKKKKTFLQQKETMQSCVTENQHV